MGQGLVSVAVESQFQDGRQRFTVPKFLVYGVVMVRLNRGLK